MLMCRTYTCLHDSAQQLPGSKTLSSILCMYKEVYTCLLVALATSIMLINSCGPFTLADRAFRSEHMDEMAFLSSVVTSASFSVLRLVSPRVRKSWYKSGA